MKQQYEKPVLIKYDKLETAIKDREWPGVVSEGNLGTWSSLDCDKGKIDPDTFGGYCLSYSDRDPLEGGGW